MQLGGASATSHQHAIPRPIHNAAQNPPIIHHVVPTHNGHVIYPKTHNHRNPTTRKHKPKHYRNILD
jgi:hypothetical protein